MAAVNPNSFNQSKFRVGGSGFTAFQWEGQIIGFAQGISHHSPQPVAPWVPIQPMDKRYPVQIITPAALGPGSLTVRLFERYNSKVWDSMMKITNAHHGLNDRHYNDLVQIFITMAALNKPVTCVKIINPPALQASDHTISDTGKQIYGDVFHNCVITDVRDDEDIDITKMEVVKQMTITYTRYTRYPGHFSVLAGEDALAFGGLGATTAFSE